mmetsp:Transcript_98891/g.318882  ORF Transcript_98891/g.318882 Transcript_98891/m.318882 type:complete len:239 (+) Transcript_98891:759-1475(+)
MTSLLQEVVSRCHSAGRRTTSTAWRCELDHQTRACWKRWCRSIAKAPTRGPHGPQEIMGSRPRRSRSFGWSLGRPSESSAALVRSATRSGGGMQPRSWRVSRTTAHRMHGRLRRRTPSTRAAQSGPLSSCRRPWRRTECLKIWVRRPYSSRKSCPCASTPGPSSRRTTPSIEVARWSWRSALSSCVEAKHIPTGTPPLSTSCRPVSSRSASSPKLKMSTEAFQAAGYPRASGRRMARV